MKLVIDIHEKDYQSILNSGQVPYGVVYAIMNGTPLPQGHGRLKDVDWIDDNCENHCSDKDGSWCCAWRDIDNAPTIIEADKEDSDGRFD